MKTKFGVFVVLFIFHLVNEGLCSEHPDADLTTEELIKKYGYPVEAHEVTTEDGYMITMFRVPHGKNGKRVNQKPIFMMHGLFGQCENFILNVYNNGSLAYLMADNGFDVWLGNARGSQHGRKHKHLDPDEQPEFWNFTWHEIGLYDVATQIDYILEKTKKKKLQYVGHSQGGTAFFVLTSLKPEYQQKIVFASLLAPAGFMRNARNPAINSIVLIQKDITWFVEKTNIIEFPPKAIPVKVLLSRGCKNTILRLRDLCEFIWHIAMGGNSGEFDAEMLPVAVNFIPTISFKQSIHFAQGIESGHFRPWDYGEEKNMEVYGKPLPDDYPLEIIKIPIAMYYSLGDNLAFAQDVEDMCDAVANCVRKFLIPNKQWTHADFVAALHLREVLNLPVLEFARKYFVY